MKKFLLFGVKLVVTVVLFWAVLRQANLTGIGAQISAANPWPLAVAVLALSLTMGLSAKRWQLVLGVGGRQAPLGRLILHNAVGFFFNQALPSTVGGDGMRAWLAYRDGVGPSLAIRSVLIERGLGLVFLATLAAAGLPRLLRALEVTVLPIWALEGLLFFALALGLVGLWLLQRGRWFAHFQLGRGLHALASDAMAVLRRPRVAVLFASLTVAGQVVVCITVFLAARAINCPLTFLDSLVVMPTVMLLLAIPVSIAGWGLREGIMVIGLGAFGIGASNAMLVSILFGLVNLAVGLIGGAVFLVAGRARKERDAQEIASIVGAVEREETGT